MNHRFNIIPVALAATVALATLAACGTVPERNFALEQARTHLGAAQGNPQVALHAGEELRRAATAVQRADRAMVDGKPREEVDHLAYLGGQRVTIAQETASGRAAEAVTAGAKAERDRMLFAQRAQEAQAVRGQLASSEQANERKSAELAQANRDAAQANRDAALANQEAVQRRAELARSDARAASLEQQLKAMDARRTERGIVVTLGDMLFDSGQSELQASGNASIVKLAEFMREQPQRRAAIEGYTDDVGRPADNQALSDRRARSVMGALVGMGVGADRLSAFGHGSRNPAAGNDTAEGRQANRRVEIVFAPDGDGMPKR